MTLFNSYATMKEVMTAYYIEAKTTQDKPIAWVTSGAPVEFLHAMDIIPIYPENHAAMCAASHQSVEMMEAAESIGYSTDICAYARTDIGADIGKTGPIGGLPDPGMLICSTNICKTVIKWYEVVARKYNVPLFVVDTPFLHDGISKELVDYTLMQFEDLKSFLSNVTGKPFNEERLAEVLELSDKACSVWKDILGLARTIPSPINSIDTFIHLGPIVTLRGTPVCLDYYRQFFDEVSERAAKKIGTIAEEKYRVLWDNLPIWFRMKQMSQFFEAHHLSLVVATYANSWGGLGTERYETETPLEKLAVSYLYTYINLGFKDRIAYLARLIDEYQLTGFIMHSNRSCKPYSIGMYQLQSEVSSLTGKPGVVIEADQNDPRVYSEAQIETRLEAFIEAMSENSP